MSVLDTHVHVWDLAGLERPWLADAPVLDRQMRPADVDRAGGRSTRMVFVETDCRPDLRLEEARSVAAMDWPELAGIVAGADLRARTLSSELNALASVGGVVGVRQPLQNEPVKVFDDHRMVTGLRHLADRELTFDACVVWGQLPALVGLLARADDVPLVLDHLGKPPVNEGLASENGQEWARSLKRVAALPRTSVKLSGLAAEASSRELFERHADDFIGYALDAFGPDRTMLGSDWPVSRLVGAAVPFADWIDRVERVARLGNAEWEAVANRTGERFYGLAG